MVAMRVKIRAQALRWELERASRMASLEKKPAKKGVPVRARLPIPRQVVVTGHKNRAPPIIRMSCWSQRW